MKPFFRLLAVAALATGCVTTSEHEKKIAELDALRATQGQEAAAKQQSLQARVDALETRRAALEAQGKDLASQIALLTEERAKLRKNLDDNSALVDEFKKRLEKLGQNVEKLTSERGQLAGALDATRERLEELRKQKAAAEALAATFQSLVSRLKSMSDAGQLKVSIRDGRMLIAMPNDVLFDSGRTDLKKEAQVTLASIAQVLSTISDRHFLVAGHTDNVPIRTERFPSNWELSTARAVEVTRFLVAKGMKPELLAAAGYGEFDAVAPNEPDTRSLNRRIEIVLQPNLSELPALGGLMPSAPTAR
ncbi:MAG: OmpA family protein [Archangium sp.]|nr:OmpA family protein [Archangium sp.]MDP3572448.1 OmpA family protein [Archangium sp.]